MAGDAKAHCTLLGTLNSPISPTRLQRVRQLFEDALDRDPATRDAFLAEAAAGDDELRREVATLLAALEGENSLERLAEHFRMLLAES